MRRRIFSHYVGRAMLKNGQARMICDLTETVLSIDINSLLCLGESMSSYYWAKVYIEILDDAKMGRLSDRLWRRTIELILIAKDTDKDGDLPSLDDMAWRLRTNAELLEAELTDMARVGIVENRDGGWHVSNFAKRQGAMTDADRMARSRKRKKAQEYHESVTDMSQSSHDHVTIRNTDKIREDKETDKRKIQKGVNGPPRKLPPIPSYIATPALMNVWGEWCQYNEDKGHPLAFRTAKGQHGKFEKWGEARSIAAMEHSMDNGYKGLIEPKENSQRTTRQSQGLDAVHRALGD
jgi:DNA-binding transcriptional regulator YhcF (GntR family)